MSDLTQSLTLSVNGQTFSLAQGIHLGTTIGHEEPSAYGIPPSTKIVYQDGGFVGDVTKGGSCNVNTILFNPHGNGTHTECVGHISQQKQSVDACLPAPFLLAQVVSIMPQVGMILPKQLPTTLRQPGVEALIIRTLPNEETKTQRKWLGTNPPYFHVDCAQQLHQLGIAHLLVDLPSVDAETDAQLKFHHAFWEYPQKPNSKKTITELIYVPTKAVDGVYLLNLQIAPFVNDASPSKPIIFPLR